MKNSEVHFLTEAAITELASLLRHAEDTEGVVRFALKITHISVFWRHTGGEQGPFDGERYLGQQMASNLQQTLTQHFCADDSWYVFELRRGLGMETDPQLSNAELKVQREERTEFEKKYRKTHGTAP